MSDMSGASGVANRSGSSSRVTNGPPRGLRLERETDQVVIRLPWFGRALREFLPEETRRHLRAAQREQLLAIRSLLDAAVDRLDRAAASDQSKGESRSRSIAVE